MGSSAEVCEWSGSGIKGGREAPEDCSWFSSSTGWVVLSEPQTQTPKVRHPARMGNFSRLTSRMGHQTHRP